MQARVLKLQNQEEITANHLTLPTVIGRDGKAYHINPLYYRALMVNDVGMTTEAVTNLFHREFKQIL